MKFLSMKMINKRLLGLCLLLALAIPMGSCGLSHLASSKQHVEKFDFPVESFVLVTTKIMIRPTGCGKEVPEEICKQIITTLPPLKFTSRGSGVVIENSPGKTYLLTAAHVCGVEDETKEYVHNGMKILAKASRELEVVSYFGHTYKITKTFNDNNNDICVMTADGNWANGVKISEIAPKPGDRIYNMAAPYGIFHPGVVLVFEGFFSGKDAWNHHFYTVPARPGSSGSPVLNSRGEIVSIIHSAMRSFENVGLGSGLCDIRKLVDRVRGNGDIETTTIDVLNIEENETYRFDLFVP
jgi:S1-C subfamily serine protease